MTEPVRTEPAPVVLAARDQLRMNVAGATGTARGAYESADHACGHTARQIVYAIGQGAAEDLELRGLLRGLAVRSERLSGQAVELHSRVLEAERSAVVATDSGDPAALAFALAALRDIHGEGVALHAAAIAVRRRLPRSYGDPLNVDPDWPTR